MREKFDITLIQSPNLYDKVITTDFEPPEHINIAPSNSADRVLTFRNVHNWMRNGSEQAAFESFFTALKTNGILGVVEHRAPEDFNLERMINTGYVTESYVKRLAKNAGFDFIAASDINANPLDHKNHPKGVWTLPPSLRLGDTEKQKYLKIGESDRMTLKFRKP
jgi:predicted methyltransferase